MEMTFKAGHVYSARGMHTSGANRCLWQMSVSACPPTWSVLISAATFDMPLHLVVRDTEQRAITITRRARNGDTRGSVLVPVPACP